MVFLLKVFCNGASNRKLVSSHQKICSRGRPNSCWLQVTKKSAIISDESSAILLPVEVIRLKKVIVEFNFKIFPSIAYLKTNRFRQRKFNNQPFDPLKELRSRFCAIVIALLVIIKPSIHAPVALVSFIQFFNSFSSSGYLQALFNSFFLQIFIQSADSFTI